MGCEHRHRLWRGPRSARNSRQPSTPRGAVFGLTLAFFSVLTLAAAANLIAAGLLAFTIFFYVVIYTMWLKQSRRPRHRRRRPGLAPVVGYRAGSSITFDSLLLFAIIFVWTPPHFWALALVKSRDYANAPGVAEYYPRNSEGIAHVWKS